MVDLFNVTKEKPVVKINGFTFIGYHQTQANVGYYIRKYDEHNNYDFVEAKLCNTGNKFFKKYTLGAGTAIKILDSFMFDYLALADKTGKETNFKTNKTFIKSSLEKAGLYSKENYKRYTTEAPKEYSITPEYKELTKQGYKMLYCLNSDPEKTKLDQAYVVMVREVHQDLMGVALDFVQFKPIQLIVKASYLRSGKGDKFDSSIYPDITVPISILK